MTFEYHITENEKPSSVSGSSYSMHTGGGGGAYGLASSSTKRTLEIERMKYLLKDALDLLEKIK